jgi:hypothetical protein
MSAEVDSIFRQLNQPPVNNDLKVATILKCTKAQFSKIEKMIVENFPNVFICRVQKFNKNEDLVIVSRSELQRIIEAKGGVGHADSK